MRNVWKGLVVGGLTGVAAGVILDVIDRTSRKAVAVGGQVRDHAPEAGRWVHAMSDKAGEWLHDVDVPDHLRSVAHRIKESDAADAMAEVGKDVVAGAREANAAIHRG
jgi:hypothetical protein